MKAIRLDAPSLTDSAEASGTRKPVTIFEKFALSV